MANSLRYKKYLGMMKMERHIKRKIIEGPTLRMPAPHPSAGGTSYKVGGVTAESLLVATKELRDWQGKLVRATAALIEAVKEAEDGPWEVGAGLKEEALRTWLGEQVARMDKLEESLDQKGGRMAKGAQAREKQGSAEEGQRYGAQEEWIQEETRRHRQQTKRDQDKPARDQGRGENWNRIPSPSGKPIQDRPDYEGEEELQRALEPNCQEMKGAGGSHGKETEEDDPDLAFAVVVSMEEYRVQLHVP